MPGLAAKKLLREGRSGALASPGCRLRRPLLLAGERGNGSRRALRFSCCRNLALHTKNIQADARVSLMLDERKEGDPLEGARVMLMGTCSEDSDRPSGGRRLPETPSRGEDVCGLCVTSHFTRMEIGRAHLVAGLRTHRRTSAAKTCWTDIIGRAGRSIEAGGWCDRAHECRSRRRLPTVRDADCLGAPDGDWRCVGIDPDGLELQRGRTALRLPFPQRVTGPGSAYVRLLNQLADQARAS